MALRRRQYRGVKKNTCSAINNVSLGDLGHVKKKREKKKKVQV